MSAEAKCRTERDPRNDPGQSTIGFAGKKVSWRRDVAAFHKGLALHMQRCGDTPESLVAAAAKDGLKIHEQSILGWIRTKCAPRSGKAFKFLNWLERRYGLPEQYFRIALLGSPDSHLNVALRKRTGDAQTQLRWHLPDNFNERPEEERLEIIQWIERNVLPGSTDFGKYMKKVCNEPYALRFPEIIAKGKRRPQKNANKDPEDEISAAAPQRLSSEVGHLVEFKTATFTPIGRQRKSRWNKVTTKSKIHQLGLLFGALTATPNSKISGLGVPRENLRLGLLVFPALLDRYLEWCNNRRGFYTRFEQSLLQDLRSFTRLRTGWMSQNAYIAKGLKPIPGIISQHDIVAGRRNWAKTCATMHQYCKDRSRDLCQIIRQHRDTFAPIMVVLNAESPLGEYRKIADEILRWLPQEDKYPKAHAEAVRSYLLFRFGMHLGLRQRNLRELLVCVRGDNPKTEGKLEELGCGEIRWSKPDSAWEVMIPSSAFKNAQSSFFAGNPFRLLLPDLENLYGYINDYMGRHRSILLAHAEDPGTFFIKTVRPFTKSASFDMGHFYRMWREIVQRYGIYNPYTGRGVIEGLLPHGPHGVRDVLATHVLKQTGSYDLASYAIQDTPRMVAEHYGRFLPDDKSAQAAQILNRIWMPDGGGNVPMPFGPVRTTPNPNPRPFLGNF